MSQYHEPPRAGAALSMWAVATLDKLQDRGDQSVDELAWRLIRTPGELAGWLAELEAAGLATEQYGLWTAEAERT